MPILAQGEHAWLALASPADWELNFASHPPYFGCCFGAFAPWEFPGVLPASYEQDPPIHPGPPPAAAHTHRRPRGASGEESGL